VITYRDLRAYKYQTLETYDLYVGIYPQGPEIITDHIRLSREGVLKIRAGYCWDGPSGPAFDTKNFMRASLVHDALYQLIRLGMLPKEKRGAADRLLWRVCLEDGMSSLRAANVFLFVRACGALSSQPRKQDIATTLKAP